MVSIMVNKKEYKPSLHDIMEKYYKMFRDKNQGNKEEEFFNTPDIKITLGPGVITNKLYLSCTQNNESYDSMS
jgi:hypothetical protein